MNYGFAGVAYFGMFLSWFTTMYVIASMVDKSLTNTDDCLKKEDFAVVFLFTMVKIFASLTVISLVAGVAQWLIELNK
jgi:hypothetical protein